LKQGTVEQLYGESFARSAALFPEVVKTGQTGIATLDHIQDYYKVGDGVANAGKVEALLLDGDGNYDADNPLVYGSSLNETDNPTVAGMRLARDLKHVAATIRADVGARFFHVAMGGFDSHSNQERDFFHSRLLQEVSESVAAFHAELNQAVTCPAGTRLPDREPASKVVIVTFSSSAGRSGERVQRRRRAPTTRPRFSSSATPVIGGQYGLPDPTTPAGERRRSPHDETPRRLRHRAARAAERGPGGSGPGPGRSSRDADGRSDGNSYTTFTPIPFLPGRRRVHGHRDHPPSPRAARQGVFSRWALRLRRRPAPESCLCPWAPAATRRTRLSRPWWAAVADTKGGTAPDQGRQAGSSAQRQRAGEEPSLRY
jgi:hypothetical protein